MCGVFFWLHHTALGILVPLPGIEPGPSAVRTQSPNHWTAREFPFFFLFGYMFLFLLGIYLGVELLDLMITLFNILRNCQTVFQSGCNILHSHQQCMRVPVSPHPSKQLLLSLFLIIAVIVCVKWYLPHCAFDLYFPSVLMMLSIFLCAYWPFVCILGGNVFSNSLPIF